MVELVVHRASMLYVTSSAMAEGENVTSLSRSANEIQGFYHSETEMPRGEGEGRGGCKKKIKLQHTMKMSRS